MRVDAISPVDGYRTAGVAARLLAHYDRTARRLPWRAPPGANRTDAYAVWLSEIMLQQTTVAAVIPYYARFLARWPTVTALAAADDADVMAAWAGLGYYARARNLLACARAVAKDHGGRFPDTEAGLLALPGIGPYTAAAIAAIAFGRDAVAVDANVERVVARLFAIDAPLPGGRAAIRDAARHITPPARAGDFAQAMMDLGSAICTSRAPQCLLCPLAEDCAAYRSGDPARFPVKPAKATKPVRTGTAWWIEAEGNVWLVRRPDKGLLGGMRALPSSDWVVDGAPAAPPVTGDWKMLDAPVIHVFTHFRLELGVAVLRLGSAAAPPMGGAGDYWPMAALASAGLPTVFRKAADAVMAERT